MEREHSNLSCTVERGSEIIEMEPDLWVLVIVNQPWRCTSQQIKEWKHQRTSLLPAPTGEQECGDNPRDNREVRGIRNWLWLPGLHATTHLNGTWKKVESRYREKQMKLCSLPTWVCSLSFILTTWTLKKVIIPSGVYLHELVEND